MRCGFSAVKYYIFAVAFFFLRGEEAAVRTRSGVRFRLIRRYERWWNVARLGEIRLHVDLVDAR